MGALHGVGNEPCLEHEEFGGRVAGSQARRFHAATVAAAHRDGCCFASECHHVGAGECSRGEAFDFGDRRAVGELIAPSLEHVPAIERGGVRGQAVASDHRSIDPLCQRRRERRDLDTPQEICKGGAGDAVVGGDLTPVDAQLVDVDIWFLGGPGVERRDLRGSCRAQPELVETIGDLLSALGQVLDKGPWNPGQIRDAVAYRFPRESQPCGEFVTELGFIEMSRRF